MKATQLDFLYAYERHLKETHEWALDLHKLKDFMYSASLTIQGIRNTWNHDGECVTKAWRDVGGKGKPTLKALRALSRGATP